MAKKKHSLKNTNQPFPFSNNNSNKDIEVRNNDVNCSVNESDFETFNTTAELPGETKQNKISAKTIIAIAAISIVAILGISKLTGSSNDETDETITTEIEEGVEYLTAEVVACEEEETPIVDAIPEKIVDEEDTPQEEQDRIYTMAEQKAQFPGGTKALQKYFDENMKYPDGFAEKGEKCTVLVKFTVNKDGSLQDIVVSRGVANPLLNDEAIRLVKNMPNWEPARTNDKKIRTSFLLPVKFNP